MKTQDLGDLAGRVGLDARTLGEVLARTTSPDFDLWERQVRRAGGCSHPIRLKGTITRDGSTVLDTATLPDGELLKRCGNRRESVCPSCSYEYRGDAWQLLRAGTTGGHKGMPVLAGHLEAFLTLTAPSFGHVHGRRDHNRPCRTQDQGKRCRHGRPLSCLARHGDGDPRTGQPLCPDCYDYRTHVLFNWWAPELWRRFTVYVRRFLARRLGYTQKRLGELVKVEFGKVAEFQRRGVVHFHALVRLDARTKDGTYRPPLIRVDYADLRAALVAAARHVTYTTPETPDRDVILRFGGKAIDVQQVNSGHADEITPETVAAYISKYQTKGTEDFGLGGRPIHVAAARRIGLADHVCRLVQASHDLARTPGLDLERLDRWTHMLGFRGHTFTKSRRFSTTFGALRRARADYQRRAEREARGLPDDHDDDTTLVINIEYAGRGYRTGGDALLAASIEAWTREGRELAREAAAQSLSSER
jgi:hypothetical protein